MTLFLKVCLELLLQVQLLISDLDNSPKSILLWRAIMQWLGGIGIIVMAITVLPLLESWWNAVI